MSDLTTLKNMFERAKLTSPTSDWPISASMLERDDDPDVDHVLVIGCPNGEGAYLQVQFDEEGQILQATVIETNGYPCSCKWCKQDTKCEYCGRE